MDIVTVCWIEVSSRCEAFGDDPGDGVKQAVKNHEMSILDVNPSDFTQMG